MSGGSFNYLCHSWDARDLYEKMGDLQDMADELARLGYAEDVAKETQTLLADLRAADVRAQVACRRLQEVWKAVEWWHSCDSSEDAVKSALVKYRGVTKGKEND